MGVFLYIVGARESAPLHIPPANSARRAMSEPVVKEEPPEWPADAVLKKEELPPDMPAGARWLNTEQAGVAVGQVADAGSRSKRGWVLAELVVPWASRALALARGIFKKQEQRASWTELPAYLAKTKRGTSRSRKLLEGKATRTRDKFRKRAERAQRATADKRSR